MGMRVRLRLRFASSRLLPLALVAGLSACSSSPGPSNPGVGGSVAIGSGGASPTGGVSGAGGAVASGGAAGSGGLAGAGGAVGGASAGGRGGTGGATGNGGTSGGTGGGVGSGGVTTGPLGSGGIVVTGGSAPAGGSSAGDAGSPTGGVVGSGGRSLDGGAGATGGGGASDARPGSGGTAAQGGVIGAAGAGGLGGRTGSGGSAGSGASSGTGGVSSTHVPSYLLGADITNAESASSAAQQSLLSQLQTHGFNAIRLRTFVDPKAADGYDQTNGYADIAHTVSFGKKVKDLGMALLVDFHYSDNWADPGKQCVPVAWQGYTTIDDLATAVHDYTKDSISKLIAGGARPDMVQIGNETTPGMLLHVCDSGGQPTGSNKVTGSVSNWTNLGTLFKAGVKGVKDVDTGILIALHIDRCGDKPTETQGSALSTSKTYITNATKQGVQLDVFGESCYQKYQGDPNNATTTKAGWTNTFTSLATAFPNLKLMAAEYGPMQREINDVVFGVANQQGIGTFNWEPDTSGDWNTGHVLFTQSGNTYTPQPDLALHDQMKVDYASRL